MRSSKLVENAKRLGAPEDDHHLLSVQVIHNYLIIYYDEVRQILFALA